MSLRFDSELRFACGSCARCCRGHEIAVGFAEAEALRAAHAGRYFRERDGEPEGAATATDPFAPVRRAGVLVIRRRVDGSCGFLSADNRCRIHEALGARQKPLSCRLFPFSVRPGTGSGPVLVASHACPSVVRGDGPRLGDQAKDLGRLAREWEHVHPGQPAALELTAGHALARPATEALRAALLAMLGDAELRRGLGRIAGHLADLTRSRALALADERRAEYVVLTSTHRAGPNPPAVAVDRPGPLARLLFRGFLFAVLALRERRGSPPGWAQRLRLGALLLHVHGLSPGLAGARLGAVRGVRVAVEDPAVTALLGRFLHQAIETAGGGTRPLADEVAFAAAQAQAALRLARMRAGLAGRNAASLDDVHHGLIAAADLDQVDHGLAARLLSRFAGQAPDACGRLAAELGPSEARAGAISSSRSHG